MIAVQEAKTKLDREQKARADEEVALENVRKEILKNDAEEARKVTHS